ncbi:MAG: hypothetical protein AB8E82_12975 [Aureispira sp.]
MSKFQSGDVVLAYFPFEDKIETKPRPVVIIEVYDDSSFTCMITGTDRSDECRGFWVEKDSKEGRAMRLRKDSFINADRTAELKHYMIVGSGPMGYCPYIKELENMLL